MIVATAGHIDHGKTALIKALTGIDADRLPEEKKRGITVDLGFAYQHTASGQSLGFVDVPGHEKLVRTMLAGATGVDFVILVVAADDGIMPQTREHLAILDLLGISRGIAVVTKIDKVDDDRVARVVSELEVALQGSVLADVEILPISAQRGDGIDALKAAIDKAASETRLRHAGGGFRLAIDRAFSLTGVGLVVTGTVHAGRVVPGDRLMLAPLGREIRVRGLHAQNEQAELGRAGQRCALNIVGPRVEKADIGRGAWIVAPRLSRPTSRADVHLRLLPSEAKPLRHWTPVHVHIGAADISGRIALLEGTNLAPGERALAQIVLDHPTSTLTGDRFVIRDQSGQRTIGGGRVLDPGPPRRNTRKAERLAVLRALDEPRDELALDALIDASPLGLDLDHFAWARNIEAPQLDALIASRSVVRASISGKPFLFAMGRWDALRTRAIECLDAYQTKHPDSFGATIIDILRLAPVLERPAVSAALDGLVGDKAVVRFGQLLHLPGHEVKLSLDDENIWHEVEQMLRAHGDDPPRLSLVADHVRLPEEEIKPLLEKLARMGRLQRLGKAYFVLPQVVARLAAAAKRCAEAHPETILTVGQFREATGIGRHATMPVLEFFDRVGFTSRHADGRRLRATGAMIFTAPLENNVQTACAS